MFRDDLISLIILLKKNSRVISTVERRNFVFFFSFFFFYVIRYNFLVHVSKIPSQCSPAYALSLLKGVGRGSTTFSQWQQNRIPCNQSLWNVVKLFMAAGMRETRKSKFIKEPGTKDVLLRSSRAENKTFFDAKSVKGNNDPNNTPIINLFRSSFAFVVTVFSRIVYFTYNCEVIGGKYARITMKKICT